MIEYITDRQPAETGVYACRIASDYGPGLYKDIFLLWYKNEWFRLGSDQKFRESVCAWIGPLQRNLSKTEPGKLLYSINGYNIHENMIVSDDGNLILK